MGRGRRCRARGHGCRCRHRPRRRGGRRRHRPRRRSAGRRRGRPRCHGRGGRCRRRGRGWRHRPSAARRCPFGLCRCFSLGAGSLGGGFASGLLACGAFGCRFALLGDRTRPPLCRCALAAFFRRGRTAFHCLRLARAGSLLASGALRLRFRSCTGHRTPLMIDLQCLGHRRCDVHLACKKWRYS